MICLFGIYICRYTGFCLSLVSYVDMCVIFVVDCVLRLLVSRDEEASLFSIRGVWC
jgi:hypothetical protein